MTTIAARRTKIIITKVAISPVLLELPPPIGLSLVPPVLIGEVALPGRSALVPSVPICVVSSPGDTMGGVGVGEGNAVGVGVGVGRGLHEVEAV